MSLDPITTEVVTSRLREVAATMEHALYHSGYSPILRESRDGTAGLTDAEGRVLIVGGGLQYHSLPYQQAVRGVVERYGFREGLCPVSEDTSSRTLALPFFTALEADAQERVVEALADALA